jgi:hypothetical protein
MIAVINIPTHKSLGVTGMALELWTRFVLALKLRAEPGLPLKFSDRE